MGVINKTPPLPKSLVLFMGYITLLAMILNFMINSHHLVNCFLLINPPDDLLGLRTPEYCAGLLFIRMALPQRKEGGKHCSN